MYYGKIFRKIPLKNAGFEKTKLYKNISIMLGKN
jgi:hypothetical protein